MKKLLRYLRQNRIQRALEAKQPAQAACIRQWRTILSSEFPVLRAAHPIPRLDELSPLEQLQAQVIAKEISVVASPQSIAFRQKPSVFQARLSGLAALHVLYPQKFPTDLFAVTLLEINALETKLSDEATRHWPYFSFGAVFESLKSASPMILKRIALKKQVELSSWADFSGREVFLYRYFQKSGWHSEYERCDVYSWDGVALRLLEQDV